MVMFGGLGTVVGATYAPPFEINPCVESPLLGVASAISQNTFWSIVPFTVAVNVCDPPLFNETVAGATRTPLFLGRGGPPPPLLWPLSVKKKWTIVRCDGRARGKLHSGRRPTGGAPYVVRI